MASLTPKRYAHKYCLNTVYTMNHRNYLPSQHSSNICDSIPYYFSTIRSNIEPWTTHNRNGLIQCAVSENLLSNHLLIPKINSIQSQINITSETLQYSSSKYHKPLQESTADFIHKYIANQYKLSPNNFIITSGVGGLWAPLFHCISEPNDIILLPIPFFAGFEIDMKLLTSVNLVSIDTYPNKDYNVSIETLDELYNKYGNKIKGLVFTSPNNPLGKLYNTEQIQMVFKWCVQHNIHFICDELFALCKIDKKAEFQSCIDCLYTLEGFEEYFHFVYGLAKDMCLSGLRIGYYYTENEYIRERMKYYHYHFNVPIYIQQLIHQIFSDKMWCDMFVNENQSRIQNRFDIVQQCLNEKNIEYYDPKYGLCVWLNMSAYLQKMFDGIKNDTRLNNVSEREILFKLEKELFLAFVTHNLALAPGQCFRSTIPGYFRLCFTIGEDDQIIVDAVNIISNVMQNMQTKNICDLISFSSK